ncbi:MAG TPA: DUF397 domain-containing protein [Pseudonocardiaceae bacterium]|nr:DUF397 domain-containing protein [Pseudonocardiaceae bacterium]
MMTAREPGRIVWHTSSCSYSTTNGDCVQVAPAPERVLVRDSKDPNGPALTIPTPAWRAFLATLTP